MKIPLKTLVAVATLAWQWNRQRRQRQALALRGKQRDVSTWEGEGGALPASATLPGRAPAKP